MTRFAPRLSHRLVEVIERESKRRAPIAEICRRVGGEAERMGLPRPSYEEVRRLVHRHRRFRVVNPSAASVVADVVFRVRPPQAIADHVSGVGVATNRRR
jgi:hypothetical protein